MYCASLLYQVQRTAVLSYYRMGGWVDRFVGVSIVGRGGDVFFLPPLYRPRAGIVGRTASFIIIMLKVNSSSQQELLSCCFFDHVSPT